MTKQMIESEHTMALGEAIEADAVVFHVGSHLGYGFEDAAREVQDLYLEGKKDEAAAALPGELIDTVTLCGPADVVRERIAITASDRPCPLTVTGHRIDNHSDGAYAVSPAAETAIVAERLPVPSS